MSPFVSNNSIAIPITMCMSQRLNGLLFLLGMGEVLGGRKIKMGFLGSLMVLLNTQ
jgi:hypothetical protein